MRDKSEALSDFIKNIERSWTYDRMTEQERERLSKTFSSIQAKELKGDYETRQAALQLAYIAFLDGLGFSGWNWREPKAKQMPF